MTADRASPSVEDDTSINPKMLELLVCPLTKGVLTLDLEAGELVSRKAALAYPIRDGIPIMLVSEARPLDEASGRDMRPPRTQR